ncbi:hypothetical protein LTR37_009599 [Vermiconidia calcicola]|uniref:Uncharacterized protein n=1 Tax=Vermiconidia calcicola TaxID=1690605 RepID=A0ACC3N7V0_9PEZI|nr:hypothetical protein LTR37_009599 [Vermiconidia calcicola]
MPRTGDPGRKTAFEPKSTPKEQQKFPPQRRSIRGKAVIPKLQKDQSTLTQLEWVGTPNASRDVIIISSDHEDGDFEEPRPKKRRRKQKSKFDDQEAGQSTLTQFEKSRLSAFSGDGDGDGFEIWEDYNPERTAQDIGERQDDRWRKLPWLRQEGIDDEARDDGGAMPEIPETSQQEPASSPARVDSGVENNMVQAKHPQLQTPKKVHFTEVPSSQTPPSTRISTRSWTRNRDSQRSPLKERSTNVQFLTPSKRSPGSQNISMKMLENVRLGMRRVPLNDTANHAILMASEKENTEAPAPRPLPKLPRVTTVQNSQADDTGLPDTQAVFKSPIKPARSPAKPTRRLQRVNTVQDSQFDDADLLLEEGTNVNDLGPYQSGDDEGAEDQQFYHDDEDDVQATFDPANSALDRDAARFGWTQTQRHFPDVHEEHEDSDDDEDLDRGCTRRACLDVPQISSERSQELGEAREAPLVRSDEVEADEPPAETELQKPPQDDSAYESSDHAPCEAGGREAVPSSPPLLHSEQPALGGDEVITIPSSPLPHPSQISTVVPTQCSPSRPSSRHTEIASSSLQNIDMTVEEASTIATSSPHKSYPVFQNTWRSSSPLPLPPWSSPSREAFAAVEKNWMVVKGATDLVDWSLPPPPSTLRGSSSRRGTPASSSR